MIHLPIYIYNNHSYHEDQNYIIMMVNVESYMDIVKILLITYNGKCIVYLFLLNEMNTGGNKARPVYQHFQIVGILFKQWLS